MDQFSEEYKKSHYWDEFAAFAEEQDVSLEHQEDWESWWLFWCAGFDASMKKTYPGLFEPKCPEPVGEGTDPGLASK